MIDLESALVDLAEHLDHPAGDDLAAIVCEGAARAPRQRVRVLLAVAAAIVVVAAAVVAIAPARRAVADWLGIGAVEVRRGTPAPTGAHPVPGAPGTVLRKSITLDEARTRVDFPIATAPGSLLGVDIGTGVPGGLVALAYPRFTLVELASQPGSGPVAAKTVDPAVRIDHVTVKGAAALWIGGAHQIAYVDRAGAFRQDTVRRSGPVLLWERGGVTYRVEGLPTLAAAQLVAATLHVSP